MDHFVPGLAALVQPFGVEMPVTPGPVRTTETGVGEAHPCTEHDDDHGKRGAEQREAPEPHQTLRCCLVLSRHATAATDASNLRACLSAWRWAHRTSSDCPTGR